MKSRAAVVGAIVVLLSFGSSSHEVMAWQSSRISSSRRMAKTTWMDASKGPAEIQQVPTSSSSHRRDLLFLIPKTMVAVATTVTLCPPAYAAAPGITPEAARDQWTRAAAAVDDLLQTWSTDEWAAAVGGGDIIRTKLGTQGNTSPLFQIEKALKVLRDAEDYVDDAIDFQETADEFMDALYQADSLANSSNSKTGSGSQTPPAVFVEQSKAEVVRMQRIAKSLTGKMAK